MTDTDARLGLPEAIETIKRLSVTPQGHAADWGSYREAVDVVLEAVVADQLTPAPSPDEQPGRCPHCNDDGVVHTHDGIELGPCDCPAGVPALDDDTRRETPRTSCNCRSHNQEIGERPEVALRPPPAIAASRANPDGPIMVDACIADVVRHLWDSGYYTLGSCCGHGRQDPSLVLVQDLTDIEIGDLRGEIASVDDRSWVLHRWRRIDDPDLARVVPEDRPEHVTYTAPNDQGGRHVPDRRHEGARVALLSNPLCPTCSGCGCEPEERKTMNDSAVGERPDPEEAPKLRPDQFQLHWQSNGSFLGWALGRVRPDNTMSVTHTTFGERPDYFPQAIIDALNSALELNGYCVVPLPVPGEQPAPSDDDLLTRITEALDGTTPGPWEASWSTPSTPGMEDCGVAVVVAQPPAPHRPAPEVCMLGDDEQSVADSELIAAAPALLAEARDRLATAPSPDEQPAPSWVQTEDGWGHDGLATTLEAVMTASAVLVVPTFAGGAQIELHAGGADIEIEVLPTGEVGEIDIERAAPSPDEDTRRERRDTEADDIALDAEEWAEALKMNVRNHVAVTNVSDTAELARLLDRVAAYLGGTDGR